jgi:peptide deformylase
MGTLDAALRGVKAGRRVAGAAGGGAGATVAGRYDLPMRVEIAHWPNPILTKGTKPVVKVDDELRDTVESMARLMHDLRGVGLAAPQVSIPQRFMLVCPSGEFGEEQVVINPEIVSQEGEDEMEEGCLSFPGVYGTIKRATKVHVRYRDLDWREKDLDLEGFVARIFQHEFDHLNGVVFLERMTPADRMRNREKLRALEAAGGAAAAS